MPKLSKEIWNYAKQTSGTDFAEFHKRIGDGDANELLKKFLESSMDEVRLHAGNEYAGEALATIDAIGGNYFRRGVLRREISSEIEYHRQRDHAAHTLYNYLLGWYFYSNCKVIRDELHEHISKRLDSSERPLDEDRFRRYFGGLWPYVSLMHDIGYILEGSIAPLDPCVHNAMIAEGASFVQDFFKHKFWSEFKIKSIDEVRLIEKFTSVDTPSFKFESMAQLSSELRNLREIDQLREIVFQELVNLKMFQPEAVKKRFKLPSDAFELWKTHYEEYRLSTMATNIDNLRDAYQSLIWEGIPGTGVRLLDHGVSSGLILLQYATFFYRIWVGLGPSEPNNDIRELWAYLKKKRPEETDLKYEPHWWWTSIVWATAATAIHNIQQLHTYWPGSKKEKQPLDISEDPLAYLGILVDIIQEWDRFSVYKDSIVTGALPIQGSNVYLSSKNEKVIINYKNRRKAYLVVNNLNIALNGWKNFIKIVLNKK